MRAKYLSLALLISCTPAAPKREAPPEPVQPDCSSLDLTQKVGFSTSFMDDGKNFCYKIQSRGAYFFDSLWQCDAQGKQLSEQLEFIRDFAGPGKGEMDINYILNVSETRKEFIPFVRKTSGEIYSPLPFVDVPKDMETYFQQGAKMLDQAKKVSEVCKKLLEYKPNH